MEKQTNNILSEVSNEQGTENELLNANQNQSKENQELKDLIKKDLFPSEDEDDSLKKKDLAQVLDLPKDYGKNLSPETIELVNSLKATLNIRDLSSINNFGAKSQSNVSTFIDNMLKNKTMVDLGETGGILENAVSEIMQYNINIKPIKIPFIGNKVIRSRKLIKKMQLKYGTVSQSVENIVKELEVQGQKLKIANMDVENLAKLTKTRVKELEIVIYAGEQILAEEQVKLRDLMEHQGLVDEMGKTQELREYASNINSFENRLYSLRTTRQVLLNQMVQAFDTYKASDDIQGAIRDIINNTIPMWKQQLALGVCMNVVQTAAQACNAVKDATNKLLLANSEMCKTISVESTKLSERPIVEIETLNKINNDTIETLQEKYKIIQEAKAKRQTGIEQMKKNEERLKQEIIKYSNMYTPSN